MSWAFYRLVRAFFVPARAACIREVVLGRDRLPREGPCILAVSHLSHLEPVFVSCNLPRPIRWMARIEHYRTAWGRGFLNLCNAFSVDRYGHAAPAVRRAIRLLKAGEVVGVFPEGGCATGNDSVLRGGPIKGGAATIAIATGAPIIPVVVLGTHNLNAVKPWLPTKSGQVWIAFGNELTPPKRPKSNPKTSRKSQRHELSAQLRQAFMTTYQALQTEANLSDNQFP